MNTLLFCGKVINKNLSRKININQVGLNTGNMLFWYALSHILEVDPHTLPECVWNKVDLKKYHSFITTDLIWIQQNTEYPHVRRQLEIVGDRPLIPISIGVQNHSYSTSFQIHPNTVRLLEELQERCILGVRGEYTATLLNKYGIRNISVIGCPSMYLPFDYKFGIHKKDGAPEKVSINMRTLYSPLNAKELDFLSYAAENSFDFCEQTIHPFTREICSADSTYEKLNKWMNLHKMMFFDVDDWRSFMSYQDFSIGGRFHGNVVGLWEGVPALFVTVDSRTSELCEHFSLPTMRMQDFDKEQGIQYYYEKADYTEFNKNYADRLDEFITFLKKNQLPIAKNTDGWYDRRIHFTSSFNG